MPAAPTSGAAPAAPSAAEARIEDLEARNAQLRRDVDHIALFARTLLTLLEERGVATEAQFQETLKKLEAAPSPTS
jgi:hypothetical protein